MTYKLLTLLGLIILVSCSRQPHTSEENVEGNNFDFPMKNPQLLTNSSHSDIALDSVSRKMWSDKIVPTPYYNATGLASFDKVNVFDLVAIEAMADDWSKSFLLTLDSNRGLVDFIEITDYYGDATQDEKGNETVVGTTMRTQFLPNSVFVRTRINVTIYNYQRADELTKKDSLVDKFSIDDLGRFRKLSNDSTKINE